MSKALTYGAHEGSHSTTEQDMRLTSAIGKGVMGVPSKKSSPEIQKIKKENRWTVKRSMPEERYQLGA